MPSGIITGLTVLLSEVWALAGDAPQLQPSSAPLVESPRAAEEQSAERPRLPVELGIDDQRLRIFGPDGAPQKRLWTGSGAAGGATPMLGLRPEALSTDISLGSWTTAGLGLELSISPRAWIREGEPDTAGAGAELRLGANLADRDMRGTGARTPSWYFFVGAENEVVVWNIGDAHALSGLTLRDQATVGDLQAGMAWTLRSGSQMTFGFVEREIEFNAPANPQQHSDKEQFVAFSYSFRN